jgi:hypothetical protein
MSKVAPKKEEPKEDKEAPKEPEVKEIIPPLVASAERLEKLLSAPSGNLNQAKVVRRWLGTSSGAAADATADDIKAAAGKLLDPNGPCATGRTLLGVVDAMDTSTTEEEENKHLTIAASRETECWLISLAVRILWKEKKVQQALELTQKGIEVVLAHMELVASSSLFPLLARLYRWLAMIVEESNDVNLQTTLRLEMTRAHSRATLRRDMDTQATLLNCLLRDLIQNSQSKSIIEKKERYTTTTSLTRLFIF